MTPEELKAAIDEHARLVVQLRDLSDQRGAEVKKLGDYADETKAVFKKMNDRLDAIETKLSRPAAPPVGAHKDGPSPYHSALMGWARKGIEVASEIKAAHLATKALTMADDTSGGYLASDEMVNEIIKGETEFSPIRSIARIRTTSQRTVKVRKRTASFAAVWVGEIGTRSETTGLAYGLEEMPTHEVTAEVYVSKADLEDSDFNLESEINSEFSEQFGVAEGAAFVSGNAVAKPEGFLTNGSVSYTAGGAASSLTSGDGLVNLFHAVKAAYANAGVWVMNRATLGVVRTLKDGTGVYIWQRGFDLSNPPNILGRPIVEATDMPAITTNTYPIAFGDFRRGYLIVDRIAIEMTRDPYTLASVGQVKIVGRKRLGGQVVLAEAIRKLKIATS